MSLTSPDRALHKALESAFAAAGRRCTAHQEASGEVVITFLSHVRGVWRHDGARYGFTPPGYTEPTFTCTTEVEVVRHSLDVICPASPARGH
jgi:hypothetical protein